MSKKNDEKAQYHELYAMYTHEGTKQGHKKWKMSARAFFRKPNTMVIHHILQGHVQIERIIENWPKKIDLDVDSLTTLPGTLAGTLLHLFPSIVFHPLAENSTNIFFYLLESCYPSVGW